MGKTKVALLAASLLLANVGAQAASSVTASGGTIHFTGSLVNAACAVATESADQTVALGEYRTGAFSAVGDKTALIPFEIVLNECDTSVSTAATVTFTGQTDGENSGLFAVNSSSNQTTATGVGIQILDTADKEVTPGTATSSFTLADGTNTMHYTARYVSTSATPTAGVANADVTFVVNYS